MGKSYCSAGDDDDDEDEDDGVVDVVMGLR